MALSLCEVLEVTLYFSKGFSEAAARVSAVAEAPWPLGDQLAIAGQLKREVHPRSIRLLFGSGGWR